MRNEGSSTAAVPGRSHPGLEDTFHTHVCCTLWASAPPERPSPEGGDTCRSKATRPLVDSETRKLEEEDKDRPEAPVDDDLGPARSHHQVQPVILDGDGVARGFFQQIHLCACTDRLKGWRGRSQRELGVNACDSA